MIVSGLDAATLQPTTVEGEVVRIAPLSFWGGVDSSSGRIIDPHHPDCGLILTGKIVLMPRARGSSSSSSVLAECIRRGTAPRAIVLEEADPIILIGALVAEELYGLHMPVLIAKHEES
ncbi:MAG: DUF126 domain-containing protein [Caldilineaceae bacterium]